MIVVGLGKACNNSSIAVSKNGKLFKYLKYEREKNIKQMPAPDWWYYKKLQDWNINLEDVDLFVSTDSGVWNDDYKIPLFPHEDTLYWVRKKDFHNSKEILLDHHNAHAWSNSSFNEKKQFVVIDGEGSNKNYSTSWSNLEFHRKKGVGPGAIFIFLEEPMKLHDGGYGNVSGKIMGLMEYGKINKKLFNNMMDMDRNHFYKFIKNYYTYDNIMHPEWLDFLKTIDEVCFEWVKESFSHIDKSKEVIYSGGCALNINWNRRLLDMGYKLNIEPPAYDGGLSIGCVRFGNAMMEKPVKFYEDYPYIQEDESSKNIASVQTINKVAKLLAQNKIVGWYQGKGEVGPRALGNRSILMNPMIKDGKDVLNKKVKHREPWRPYGASVKKDKAKFYFDIDDSPYMLFSSKVLVSNMPAITHIDNTCRPQTVTPNQNPAFYKLLDSFEKETNVPILLNTSLNVAGKPMCNTIKDAKELLRTTDLDYLCIGNKIYDKSSSF